ncbi:MAG: AsmA-like C-terminal region-containing protein [Vicinamibacteria bacterium]
MDKEPSRPLRAGRWLALAAAAAAALALVAAALVAWRLRSLDDETLRRAIADRLETTLGTKVDVRRAEVSLLSGVRLFGLRVAEPPPLTGALAEADAFTLRYRVLPLLLGRVEVDRLSLAKPRLFLRVDRRGAFNYEKLAPAGGGGTAAPLPLRVRLRRVSVDDGAVTASDATGAALARVEGIDFGAAIDVEAGAATGRGDARVRTLSLGDRLFVRDAQAPLRLSRDEAKLAPIRARVAGGKATGEASVILKDGFRWVVSLEVEGAKIETLLAEAGSMAGLAGSLRARARFEGTAGLATVRGRGEADVTGCRVSSGRATALVAAALGLPELERPEFDECRASFTQQGARMTFPSLSMKGRAFELTGRGWTAIDTGALELDMKLALAPGLYARLTRPEVRPAFRTRADGFAEIDFRLTGTTAAPRTDLPQRLARGAATHVVTERVGRWLGFGKKKD